MSEVTSFPDVTPRHSRWREFWIHDTRANPPWYKTANEAQPSQEFVKKMKKRITVEEQHIVDIADADLLEQLVSDSLGQAVKNREKHAHNRQPIRKAGKATVTFANNFSSYLQAYSGIIEIMQGADQQYGGVAYSALSLLLIVAINKQRKEDHIDAALLVLQREFSRAKLLREIHRSDSMKEYIARAYKLGIDFTREVTIYYSRPTYRRVVEAVTKPPQLNIDIKISEITEAITEIEKERATLDSLRLFQVHQRIKEVKKGVDEVRVDVEASHVQNERKNLALLRENFLLQGSPDPDEVLTRYSSEVAAAFRNIQRLPTFTFSRLAQEESYGAWERSRISCMMLLHGRTAVRKTGYSWLSPAIFELIAQRRAQKQLVIFGLCQDQPFMEKDVPAHAVLSSLISQLLGAKASILRDDSRYHELSRKFSDPAWRNHQSGMPFVVLREILCQFPNVDIVIDRADRIRGDADSFMNSLVSLIKDSKTKIRIFIVSSSNGYDRVGGKFSEELQERVKEDLGSDRFWRLEANQ